MSQPSTTEGASSTSIKSAFDSAADEVALGCCMRNCCCCLFSCRRVRYVRLPLPLDMVEDQIVYRYLSVLFMFSIWTAACFLFFRDARDERLFLWGNLDEAVFEFFGFDYETLRNLTKDEPSSWPPISLPPSSSSTSRGIRAVTSVHDFIMERPFNASVLLAHLAGESSREELTVAKGQGQVSPIVGEGYVSLSRDSVKGIFTSYALVNTLIKLVVVTSNACFNDLRFLYIRFRISCVSFLIYVGEVAIMVESVYKIHFKSWLSGLELVVQSVPILVSGTSLLIILYIVVRFHRDVKQITAVGFYEYKLTAYARFVSHALTPARVILARRGKGVDADVHGKLSSIRSQGLTTESTVLLAEFQPDRIHSRRGSGVEDSGSGVAPLSSGAEARAAKSSAVAPSDSEGLKNREGRPRSASGSESDEGLSNEDDRHAHDNASEGIKGRGAVLESLPESLTRMQPLSLSGVNFNSQGDFEDGYDLVERDVGESEPEWETEQQPLKRLGKACMADLTACCRNCRTTCFSFCSQQVSTHEFLETEDSFFYPMRLIVAFTISTGALVLLTVLEFSLVRGLVENFSLLAETVLIPNHYMWPTVALQVYYGIKYGGYGVGILTFTIFMLMWKSMFTSYKKSIMSLRQGKATFKPRDYTLINADNYIGYQLAHVMLAYMVTATIVFLVTLIIILAILVPTLREPIKAGVWFLLSAFGPPILVAMSRYVLIRLFFLRGGTVYNRDLYCIFDYLMIFFNVITGFATCAVRFSLGLFFQLFYFWRLDVSVYPTPVSSFDGGYSAYIAMLLMDHQFNNPIGAVFTRIVTDTCEHKVKLAIVARMERDYERVRSSSSMPSAGRSSLGSGTAPLPSSAGPRGDASRFHGSESSDTVARPPGGLSGERPVLVADAHAESQGQGESGVGTDQERGGGPATVQGGALPLPQASTAPRDLGSSSNNNNVGQVLDTDDQLPPGETTSLLSSRREPGRVRDVTVRPEEAADLERGGGAPSHGAPTHDARSMSAKLSVEVTKADSRLVALETGKAVFLSTVGSRYASSRAFRRWLLAYTLVRNPQLVLSRKHFIQHLKEKRWAANFSVGDFVGSALQ